MGTARNASARNVIGRLATLIILPVGLRAVPPIALDFCGTHGSDCALVTLVLCLGRGRKLTLGVVLGEAGWLTLELRDEGGVTLNGVVGQAWSGVGGSSLNGRLQILEAVLGRRRSRQLLVRVTGSETGRILVNDDARRLRDGAH